MDGESPALQQLQRHLAAQAPGAITDIGKLAALLAGCWHQFEGARTQGMNAGKLARMEAARWELPVLSFTLERHGALALALGSTRAELQRWCVDLGSFEASCSKDRGYRQLRPRAERVKTEPVAADLAEAISAGQADDRLKWGHDGTVCVVLTRVFPHGRAIGRLLPDGASGSARRSSSFWQRAAGAKSGATFTPEKPSRSTPRSGTKRGRGGRLYARAAK